MPTAQHRELSLEDKLFTVSRRRQKESHIKVDSSLCGACSSRICTRICPAGVYVWNEEEESIRIQYENCLECGSCRVACEMGAIEWMNPPGGTGIEYRES